MFFPVLDELSVKGPISKTYCAEQVEWRTRDTVAVQVQQISIHHSTSFTEWNFSFGHFGECASSAILSHLINVNIKFSYLRQ